MKDIENDTLTLKDLSEAKISFISMYNVFEYETLMQWETAMNNLLLYK